MSDFSIELGEDAIRAVSGKPVGNKLEVSGVGEINGVPPFYSIDTEKIMGDEAAAIKKLLSLFHQQKKTVNIIIPDTYAYSQILEMPALNEKELLSAIKYQADQFIPMPIEETSLDLEILYEDKKANKLRVLIVAAPQNILSRIEKLCDALGIYPEIVESEQSAASRFITRYYVPPQGSGGTLFVNLGFSTGSCYFFHDGLRLIFDTHSFKIGYSLFFKEIQADTTYDPQKIKTLLSTVGFSTNSEGNLTKILEPSTGALLDELDKYIASLKVKFSLSSISHIYVFNYASQIYLLDKIIEKRFNVSTSVFDVSPFISKTNDLHTQDLSPYVCSMGGCLQ